MPTSKSPWPRWQKGWQTFLSRRYAPSLFILIFTLIWNLPLVYLQNLTPDGCLYLDMGRNIFEGKGAILTLNFHFAWTGYSYPSLPYLHPVYPIIAGFIWMLTHSIDAVLAFNVAMLTLCALLLYQIYKIITTKEIAFLGALIYALIRNNRFVCSTPLTDYLHFAFILLALLLLFKKRSYKESFLAGIIIGFAFLVRVANLYASLAIGLALLLAAEGTICFRLKRSILYSLGVLLIILPYEFFCYFHYGIWYPQYTSATKALTFALDTPSSHFVNGNPSLVFTPQLTFVEHIKLFFKNTILHLMQFLTILTYPILSAIYLYFFRRFRRRLAQFEILSIVLLSLFSILGYSVSIYWWRYLEWWRYSIIPIACGLPLAAMGLHRLLAYIRFPYHRFRYMVLTLTFCIALGLNIYSAINYNLSISSIAEKNRSERTSALNFVNENSSEDDLITTNLTDMMFLFNRPFINLPYGKILTEDNLKDFLNIHKPKLILIYYLPLHKLPFNEVYSNFDPKYHSIILQAGYSFEGIDEYFRYYKRIN